ncbi:MAG: hypothetical protein ABGZ35_13795 [Planctomycetaceae bacterium]
MVLRFTIEDVIYDADAIAIVKGEWTWGYGRGYVASRCEDPHLACGHLLPAPGEGTTSLVRRAAIFRGRAGSARARHSLPPRATTPYDFSKTALDCYSHYFRTTVCPAAEFQARCLHAITGSINSTRDNEPVPV